MVPNTLGEHIRKTRIEQKLLQIDAARSIGVTEQCITNWEGNKSHPQIQHYPAIIAFLGYYPFYHAMDTVAGKFLFLRNSRGYSYETIGALLNVHASTVRAWELDTNDTMLAKALKKINRLT